MNFDLEQFHEPFFQESLESLEMMEAALLKLTQEGESGELINTIFRVAHSIKGGSATFGFKSIAEFTHTAETLLEQIRSGKRRIQAGLVEVLLKSVDVIRDMLTANRAQQSYDTETALLVHQQLHFILKQDLAVVTPVLANVLVKSSENTQQSTRAGWRIAMKPKFQMGHLWKDPIVILRELSLLGSLDVRVDAAKVPTLAELNPEQCVLSWNLMLQGDVSLEQINAVFDSKLNEYGVILESVAAKEVPAAAESELAPPELLAQDQAIEASDVEVAQLLGEIPLAAPAVTVTERKLDLPKASHPDSSSIRVNIEKIDEMLNCVGELVIVQSLLGQLVREMDGRHGLQLKNILELMDRYMHSLQDSVMRARMLPIASIFNRLPRMVHDLSSRLGKKVELQMQGDQTELDKTVLEKISDPLVHLVRNAIDHGIETKEQRLAVNKKAEGSILLRAYHKGGNVMVEVSDDGAGINPDKVLAKARERGLVSPDAKLSRDQILELIFMPGFSTADVVSDVSGRGVGMDVVRNNIKEIGGHVQIDSTLGKGSTVLIRLPLTLAIVDGQFARVGNETYVIPIVSIVETVIMKAEQVNVIANRAMVYRLREECVPIVNLRELFEVPSWAVESGNTLLMIVEVDNKRVGLMIDELLTQQQVVIKNIETNFRQVECIAGATMLGDGGIALILDIAGIINCASKKIKKRDEVVRAE